jgi:hypothetical protein
MSSVAEQAQASDRRRTVRDVASSTLGAILGLAPHVLHHVGFIAGSALITGAGGSIIFYTLGLVLSLPMLRRLYRRFRTWRAPVIAVLVFSAVFALSNLVIGPAISGDDQSPERQDDEHTEHHAQSMF